MLFRSKNVKYLFQRQKKKVEKDFTMEIDAAFQGVGNEAGLIGWRIEDKKVVRLPSDKLYQLYMGDSYIFLKTIQRYYSRIIILKLIRNN